MSRGEVWILPGQMSLFTEEELRETCPLCGAAGELTTCRRMYNTLRACRRCVDALKVCGWFIVQ
jgi:hypothetical protein